MAVNIYGSCSGSTGNRFNLWLKVTQNSQSIANNESNVTVALYIKRNDGSSVSAYNLNESDNSVKLTVGGKEKVNKNLAIDTRNCVTVKLASWTGDVSHKTDGTLDLEVKGSFTMTGTTLSGGSVSGEFSCTDIPRASALSLSASSVNPGGSVTAEITSASTAFSHKVKLSLGDEDETVSFAAGTIEKDITVPTSWASQVTTAKKGNISVVLTTYKGTKKIGSKTYSLTLSIPSTADYKPDFTLSVSRIDNSVPSSFGMYVKGISQVKLNISGLSLKYGAKVSSYTATVGSKSKTTLPATFSLNSAGSFTVSVTVKDSRGFSVKKSSTITVVAYSAPTVTVNSLSRCDSAGNKSLKGTSALANLRFIYSSLNSKNSITVTYKYRKVNSTVFSSEKTLSSASGILPGGYFETTSSYIIAFKIVDSITKTNRFIQVTLSSAQIPFNIRKGGKGAAFGCYAEKDNELKIAWDLNVGGKIYSEDVPVTTSDKITGSVIVAKYIPCLEMVFVRMRLNANQELEAQKNHVVATMQNRVAGIFTPFCVEFNNNGDSVAANGGIMAQTGEIVISSENTIAKERNIYISGFYYPNF